MLNIFRGNFKSDKLAFIFLKGGVWNNEVKSYILFLFFILNILP